MPAGKLVKVGVWEDGFFIGCVLFGRGSNRHMAGEFGLEYTEVYELVRVALKRHKTPTSRVIAIALKMIKKTHPRLRLLVSYADPEQEHAGIIYQATNWIYTGVSQSSFQVYYDGRWQHPRSVNSKVGTIKGLNVKQTARKHRYLYPFDDDIKNRISGLTRPFPDKRGDAS